MRKLVVLYFILINLTGFTLSVLEGSDFLPGGRNFFTKSSDTRLLTVSAFGGGIGSYGGILSGGKPNLDKDRELNTALQLLIAQNLFSFVVALKAFGRRKRSADYHRSSLTL